jgi:hypothetical protein
MGQFEAYAGKLSPISSGESISLRGIRFGIPIGSQGTPGSRVHHKQLWYAIAAGVYCTWNTPLQEMASIMAMPVEIVLEIIHLILDEHLILPAVGRDAPSVVPPDSQIRWKQSLKKRIIRKCHEP